MSQWYPPPASKRTGPRGQPGVTAPPPAPDADDDGYVQGGSHPGHAPTMGYGQPGVAVTAAVPEQYRRLRARTTPHDGVLRAAHLRATLVFLVAGFGHYSASSGALGASVLLVNAVRIFQLLSRRKRIASMTGTPEAGGPWRARHAGSPTPTGYGMPTATGAQAAAEFSQQFCPVTRVTAGGNLNAGIPDTDFLVSITGDWLSVTQAPAIPVFSVPASEVQITTPRWQRKIGTGSILGIGGQPWSVQFGSVYRAEAAHAGRGGAIRAMLSAGAPRQSLRRGREINERFTAKLLTAGAIDTSAAHASGAAAYG